jgi:hypothetical protein
MNINRFINFILILAGGLVAIYAKAEEEQNQYILIGGIVVLMIGLYRLSRGISSRNTSENDTETNENEQ